MREVRLIEKYEFTYEDYIALTKKKYFGIRADLIEQEIDEDEGNKENEKNQIMYKHDKSFKKALGSHKEMSRFLEDFLDIKVKTRDLQKYATEHITERYKTRQSDIVYKKKSEQIYYIVEQQSTVDVNMPYRMLNYCMELMRDVIENNNEKIYPTIVPIVIYTGKREWTVPEDFAKKQLLSKGQYKDYKIEMGYELIDINKMTEEELLIKQTYTASLMLIEKSKTKEEMLENIKKIIENTKDIRQLMKLKRYIILIQGETLQKEEEKLVRMIYAKMGDDEMSTLVERLKRENEAIRRETRKETRLKDALRVITKMLRNGETDEKIKMYTDATDEQIQKRKKQLGLIN